jgi:hypothetical protein
MDRETAEVRASDLDLTGMHAGAYLNPERPDGVGHRQGAPDRLGRRGERGEEAVAARGDLPAPEPLELSARERVVLVEEVPPPLVAQLRGSGRRVHDVGEQQRS